MAGQDVGAPPDRLWVHQEGVYRDEYQRTWVAVLEEETSFLRARVQQVQVPLGDAARPSHLLTSQLPLMWQLYPEERYMDNNSRLSGAYRSCCLSFCLMINRKDPCQKQACEIQKCLQANNYMESKCQAVIEELRKCCARYPKGRSLVCSGFEKEEEEKQTLKRTPQ
ncbi:MTCP1 [Cervus elaphus hippelaphus]|uniref:Cx9C motif-containing protein 4 n=1 Tax=Cervus elaphus hippelaphus TaxID=46360 RepID=A0A212C0F5_CEREH|nr:MTCP1 [Cervus elaphus hippelaphus]